MNMLALEIADLSVEFPGFAAPVLHIPSFQLQAGQSLAVTGASGSGKTTFVNMICGLEAIRKGHVRWGGQDLASLSETARDRFRLQKLGLVMQEFHLFPGLSALENVLLPAKLAGILRRADRERAAELLEQFAIKRADQKVETMSRGEMQRVAVARAVLLRPAVLVADEPTASLDQEAGQVVADLLLSLAKEHGASLIIVTHDPALKQRLDRQIALSAGQIMADGAGDVA